MDKLTTERLEEMRDHYLGMVNKDVGNALTRLMAYEQAAKNPVAFVDERSAASGGICWAKSGKRELPHGTELYAAPVLPKQPEPENKIAHIKRQKALAWLKRVAYENPCMKEVKTCIEVLSAPAQPALVEKLKKVMNSWLAMEPKLAFQPEFTDVMMLLDAEPAPAQPVIPEQTERERIRREHAEWSDATFGNVGPVGPLKHLSKEALEAAADPDDLLELADMQFLLWDAQRRAGIPDDFITVAMIEKLEINKKRQWPEPKDGEPRLHINTQSAQPVSEPYKSAANDIIAERQRQISEEGWTPEHDDEHDKGELAMAAVCYINETGTVNRNGGKPWGWPWDASWWKPDTRRRNLVKSGALILAEIERIDRIAPAQESE